MKKRQKEAEEKYEAMWDGGKGSHHPDYDPEAVRACWAPALHGVRAGNTDMPGRAAQWIGVHLHWRIHRQGMHAARAQSVPGARQSSQKQPAATAGWGHPCRRVMT